MTDLTVIILTKNEEKNIEKCIKSFRGIAKRFVIVDSYSTDKTKTIAEKLNIDFYEHKFENHALQFNWALKNTNIKTKWVMKIDADEELTEELANEINEKLDNLTNNITGIILRRRTYFLGRWLKHGGKYPELLLRIFRINHGCSEIRQMDEHLIVKDGDVITLKNDFIDNNQKDLEWWTNKHNWYSNKEVLEYQDNTKKESNTSIENTNTSLQAKIKRKIKNNGYYRLPIFFRAHLYFIYRYYFRLGFLDGKEGKIYTFLQAYWYRFLVDAKIYECEKKGKRIEKQSELKV